MKKFFDKDNFILSTFDKGQKRQSLIISLALVVFFVFSAFTFMNGMYSIVKIDMER